ncbi:MAG: tetratricopeptide repeat protein [Bdellovibrionota bacterium]
MYIIEKGVSKDFKEAFKWAKKAADQGNPRGAAYVGMMYFNGEGVATDKKEALKWLQIAKNQNEDLDAKSAAINFLREHKDVFSKLN